MADVDLDKLIAEAEAKVVALKQEKAAMDKFPLLTMQNSLGEVCQLLHEASGIYVMVLWSDGSYTVRTYNEVSAASGKSRVSGRLEASQKGAA